MAERVGPVLGGHSRTVAHVSVISSKRQNELMSFPSVRTALRAERVMRSRSRQSDIARVRRSRLRSICAISLARRQSPGFFTLVHPGRESREARGSQRPWDVQRRRERTLLILLEGGDRLL